METREVTVFEDTLQTRFAVAEDEIAAELNYQAVDNRLVITRTYTPPEFRGQGIAGQLVAAAVERAKKTGETVVPSCWYAREWLENNPEAAKGVKVEW